jgi:hypothetical protein
MILRWRFRWNAFALLPRLQIQLKSFYLFGLPLGLCCPVNLLASGITLVSISQITANHSVFDFALFVGLLYDI